MVEEHDQSRLFQRLSQLTLAVIGESMNHEVIQAMGSAFFIAPYTVVTAAHVIEGLWDELQSPHKRGRFPRGVVENAFYAILGHVPDPDRPDVLARWQATSAITSAFTDIGFMNVVPVNEVAERLSWPTFPELVLLPPEEGAMVASLGYPEVTHEEISEGVVKFSVTSKLTTGRVLSAWDAGRASWSFPQFETDADFAHGMSGGPVIHAGKIYGVVSYATLQEDGALHSYAATFWPTLLAGPAASVDPRSSIPLLSMLETGAIQSAGWRAIYKRTAVTDDEGGKRVAVLRSAAG